MLGPFGPLVSHPERCPPNMKLLGFISWWKANGPFPIVIVSGSRNDAQQLVDYARGRKCLPDGEWVVVDQAQVVTNARTAGESAHGHDAGIDCSPVREFFPMGGVRLIYLGDGSEPPTVHAEALRRFRVYDELAREHGLETGEKYPGICDRPHACDPNWRNLPLSS